MLLNPPVFRQKHIDNTALGYFRSKTEYIAIGYLIPGVELLDSTDHPVNIYNI